jgi:hypothetical protein
MSWVTTTLRDADGHPVTLALPPGWWRLSMSDPDLPGLSREIIERQAPDLLPDYAAELARIARVAALAGAVMLAGGAAVSPESGQLVSASLLVAPASAASALRSSEAVQEGPSARLELPAGVATRRTFLGTMPCAAGDIFDLEVRYVVVPAAPPSWLLSFRTPALRHVDELIPAFDAIAATLTPDPAPVAAAFS